MYLHAGGLRFSGVALARSQLALQVASGVTLFETIQEGWQALHKHGDTWESFAAASHQRFSLQKRSGRAHTPSALDLPHGVSSAALGASWTEEGSCPLIGLREGGPQGEVLADEASLQSADSAASLWPVWDLRVHPHHDVCREFWSQGSSCGPV